MSKKNIVDTIRNREMDRKDFLKYCALAIATVIGLKAVLSFLVDDKKSTSNRSSHGFGGGRYGA